MPIFNPILVRTGGGAAAPVSPKEVNFYDYEGTLLHAYTVAQAQALTALPDGPAHEGLVFQGWNWSLEDVKALDRPMNVGAVYITDDGKTRLYLRITTWGRMDVPLYFSQTAANGVTIDWGDGSPAETLAGTGYVNTVHTYADVGDYTVSLNPAGECELGLGAGSTSYCVMGSAGNSARVYCNLLRRAELGVGVTAIGDSAFRLCCSLNAVTIPKGVARVGAAAFYSCTSLATVVFPEGVSGIGDSALNSCYALARAVLPRGVSSIGNTAFQYCYALAAAHIPEGVAQVGTSAFHYCYALVHVTIPESVSSIGTSAFRYCYGMGECHVKSAVPPTLANANALNGIPADCVIYVPEGCLAVYQAAANWATYADRMREASV